MALLLEACGVGVVLAFLLAVAVHLSGPITTSLRALGVGLCLGAVTHILFEFSGANAWYCGVRA